MLRQITIQPVLNGFIVTVGCQQLAYTNPEKLTVDIASYLRDPDGTEKRILADEAINLKHTMPEHGQPALRGLQAARDGGEILGHRADRMPMTAPSTDFVAAPGNG